MSRAKSILRDTKRTLSSGGRTNSGTFFRTNGPSHCWIISIPLVVNSTESDVSLGDSWSIPKLHVGVNKKERNFFLRSIGVFVKLRFRFLFLYRNIREQKIFLTSPLTRSKVTEVDPNIKVGFCRNAFLNCCNNGETYG